MAIFPYLDPTEQTRLTVESFGGYDHRPACPEASFYEMENLSSRHYPLLSTRPERGVVRGLDAPSGLIGKDALAFVENGTLYYNDLPTAVTGLSAGQKQLVGMGAYILIFPDKRYFNTEDFTDHGEMEAHQNPRAERPRPSDTAQAAAKAAAGVTAACNWAARAAAAAATARTSALTRAIAAAARAVPTAQTAARYTAQAARDRKRPPEPSARAAESCSPAAVEAAAPCRATG